MNTSHRPLLVASIISPSRRTLNKVMTLLFQKHQHGGTIPINILTAMSHWPFLNSANFFKYAPFAMHFNVIILVAVVCLGYLHGSNFNVNSRRPQYQEVDGSVVHVTSYALLQSDITTAGSLAATITRVAGGWWATGYIWRCIFVAMERGGISARGLLQAISNRPPAPRQFTRKSSMVIIYITLFATFAINYFSAALTGSFIWEAAVTLVPGKIPLSGIRNGTVDYAGQVASDSYLPITAITDDISPFTSTNMVDYNSEIIKMVSASASIACKSHGEHLSQTPAWKSQNPAQRSDVLSMEHNTSLPILPWLMFRCLTLPWTPSSGCEILTRSWRAANYPFYIRMHLDIIPLPLEKTGPVGCYPMGTGDMSHKQEIRSGPYQKRDCSPFGFRFLCRLTLPRLHRHAHKIIRSTRAR